MAHVYGDGTNSTIGTQLVEYEFLRKALIETEKERPFGQLVGTKAQPKHTGKSMKMYHIMPVMDDRNVNDQGIDAEGKSTAMSVTINVVDPANNIKSLMGFGADAADALTAAGKRVTEWAKEFFGAGVGTTYTAVKTALTTAGWQLLEGTAVPGTGAFYGSSKDIGTMWGKMPKLTENGGRVNRVGNTRLTIESNLFNFGFFEEWTEDSMQFDSDPMLYTHIAREATRAAYEIQEDMIQIELLNNAGVILYGGTAVSNTGLNKDSKLSYGLLLKCKQILNQNLCPTNTQLVGGSGNTDTRTIEGARYMYVGNELAATLETMVDPFGNPAFIPVHKYASATNTAKGEIGSVGGFRFIEAREMAHWAGAGAATSDGGENTYYSTDGKYDVFPCLVVGSNAFYTVNLGTVSKSKLQIYVKKPGIATADKNDPYGKMGFYSVQWWHGFMVLRPEWIACLKVTAPISI